MVGCSSAPTIIEREVEVPVFVPGIRDTVVLYNVVTDKEDSVWYSQITDTLNQVIGDLTVYWKKKVAEVNIKPRTDTVKFYFTDTVKVIEKPTVIDAVASTLSWYEKIILYGGIGLILSLLLWMKTKGIKL